MTREEAIWAMRFYKEKLYNGIFNQYIGAFDVAISALKEQPVVHGRWKFNGSDFADIWKCTACGDDWFFEYDPRDNETCINYCPNCGARMDGDGND